MLAFVVAGWAVALALTRRAPGPMFAGGALWAGIVVGAAAALGIALIASGQGPSDPLHVVYGALAFAVMPGAAMIARDRPGAGRKVVWAVAGIVLVILILRLFQTAA